MVRRGDRRGLWYVLRILLIHADIKSFLVRKLFLLSADDFGHQIIDMGAISSGDILRLVAALQFVLTRKSILTIIQPDDEDEELPDFQVALRFSHFQNASPRKLNVLRTSTLCSPYPMPFFLVYPPPPVH